MTCRLALAFLAFLVFPSAVLASGSESEEIQALKNRIKIITGEAPAIQLGTALPIKCGTPEMSSAFNVLRHHHDVELAEALDRPEQECVFRSEHFAIHYDTSGLNATYQPEVDINPADGVPDYINRAAEIFERVWAFEIDTLGYGAPPSDNNNGGDNKKDVYTPNLGAGFFGFTVPEDIVGEHSAFSYIIIDNDFAGTGYADRPIDALKVTAAHEFFHTIQFGYDAYEYENWDDGNPGNDKPWWLEASAVWMEDIAYDDINDYLGYLPFFYQAPWMSLATFEPFGSLEAYHPYGSCVWPIFLTERYDDPAIIFDIWQRCGDTEGYNVLPAIDDALSVRGSSLDDAFLEFWVWNFHTNAFADTAIYFSEGDAFPAVDTTSYTSVLGSYPFPLSNSPSPPEELGANIIVIQPEQLSGGIQAQFDGGDLDDESWKVAILGYRPQTGLWTGIPLASGSWDGTLDWYNWNSYSGIVIIPVVTGINATSGTPHEYGGNLTFVPSLFYQRDIWTIQFVSTPSVGRKGDAIIPTVKYSNQGREVASFTARLIITDVTGIDTAYNESAQINDLPMDGVTNHSFPSFTPLRANARYILKGISELDGDESALDDTIRAYFYSLGSVGRLLSAYPSPFVIDGSAVLTIPFSFGSVDSKTRLYLYDISGGLLREIEMGRYPSGGSSFSGFKWDGKNDNGDYVASGIYIYMIDSGGDSQTGKIAVINKR